MLVIQMTLQRLVKGRKPGSIHCFFFNTLFLFPCVFEIETSKSKSLRRKPIQDSLILGTGQCLIDNCCVCSMKKNNGDGAGPVHHLHHAEARLSSGFRMLTAAFRSTEPFTAIQPGNCRRLGQQTARTGEVSQLRLVGTTANAANWLASQRSAAKREKRTFKIQKRVQKHACYRINSSCLKSMGQTHPKKAVSSSQQQEIKRTNKANNWKSS